MTAMSTRSTRRLASRSGRSPRVSPRVWNQLMKMKKTNTLKLTPSPLNPANHTHLSQIQSRNQSSSMKHRVPSFSRDTPLAIHRLQTPPSDVAFPFQVFSIEPALSTFVVYRAVPYAKHNSRHHLFPPSCAMRPVVTCVVMTIFLPYTQPPSNMPTHAATSQSTPFSPASTHPPNVSRHS